MSSLMAFARVHSSSTRVAARALSHPLCNVFPVKGDFLKRHGRTPTRSLAPRHSFDSVHLVASCNQRCLSTAKTHSISAKVETDFFGEPVTFFEGNNSAMEAIPNVMTSLDDLLLCIVSRGKSSSGGGDDYGLSAQAAHSSALSWGRVIRNAFRFHEICPMLSCVAVGPLLAQTGVNYARFLDKLLSATYTRTEDTKQDVPVVELVDMAKDAVSQKSNLGLSLRERWHLEALDFMLQQDHRGALQVILRLLHHCPGDALALSLAMDLSNTIGNTEAAMRAATTVSSYWNERGARRNSIPGYSIGASWIALGLAAGGRFAEAERLADQAMQRDKAGCGGIATYALTLAYDAEGRTSESISLLVGFDGVEQYQSSGWLFFDSHLGGHGARFSLDREGTGGGKVALRVYDNCFERILQYSGFASGTPWTQPKLRAPTKRRDRVVQSVEKGTKSIFRQLFGAGSQAPPQHRVSNETEKSLGSQDTGMESIAKQATVEDVLAWLPPTPKLLTDATLLLLRLTMNGTVTGSDSRWLSLRKAWICMMNMHQNDASLDFYPLASILVNLFASMPTRRSDIISSSHESNFGAALRLMGCLLKVRDQPLDVDDVAESEVFDGAETELWAKVVQLLSASYSFSLNEIDAWEIDARPILAHAICYAAIFSNDHDALCTARAICSKGVCLRPNSPEEWWRYGDILDQLGDEVAAEDARAASISLGSGEGYSL